MINRQMTPLSDTRRDHSPAVRLGHDAVSAVKLSQQLTADIDAWAETHQVTRSDAISQLLAIGLHASQPAPASQPIRTDPQAIEQNAIRLIDQMLDPGLPAEERERRIRRLIDGPAEFAGERIDLPKHPD
ncbi:hypothetical protein SSBR45G_50370 [Bradyrhizobium sp. SSBR45G]|uniref:hypothetical protein n=1 Tax=unclassified Bradyrhizobium TaxID=2631580 RepID=UPI002342B2FB|nr:MULTISPECIES: hypothetical protein [unclassified Bradyrhizobium]GLH80128.1 hypothetical protein SSBR45G_50370 [Bradyrhizobium sp. SSBR45G]GLH87563.1 hypothetical protein SSBR45R_50230 [Bradyrhizobium sp. SSBR45R]